MFLLSLQKLKIKIEEWQKRYEEMLFHLEKDKLENELKVERKKAVTNLATQRRDEIFTKKLNVRFILLETTILYDPVKQFSIKE